MAPIRRYLRITKYSVLECRIYLDNPALAASWLLHPRDPVLPRVIDAVRPLVLPKLREEKERERARKKAAKRRQIKDVVAGDDFEVSVFLTDTPTRHSLLAKHKRFRDDHAPPPLASSNAAGLVAETSAAPLDVDLPRQEPVVIREESDDEDAVAALAAIPAADEAPPATRTAKRRRRAASHTGVPDDDEFASTSDENENEDEDEEDEDGLFVDDAPPPSKRRRTQGAADALAGEAEAGDDDDKKKMAMDVSFEGFAIYGRVLCLVVKRKETPARAAARTAAGARAGAAAGAAVTAAGAAPGGQATMENWISSTQMPNPGAETEGDE